MLRRGTRPTGWDGPGKQGEAGVQELGRRGYVGGMWDEIGRLQFDYLVAQGLRPEHVLLDIACGSLRAGVHFIPYLNAGNYLGVEKEAALVERGLEHELPPEVRDARTPELLVNSEFEFERLSKRPDFAMAQSLFTHLPPDPIELCLSRLRGVASPGLRFYATFFEVRRPVTNLGRPHDHWAWFYTKREMRQMGARTGWDATYIGDWNHPREQMMMLYTPR
jgi:hypothetical protein